MVTINPLRQILMVDRQRYHLKLYRRPLLSAEYALVKTYPVAVGMMGHETPRGLYSINHKSKCPDWLVPDSATTWDPPLVPGTLIPCDKTPDYSGPNPLKARWLGVTDPAGGIGLHGTTNLLSIGTAGSHGCIRMVIADIIELYDMIPHKTPVVII